jgi:uncharacterized protein GlcG (DUF336 family)
MSVTLQPATTIVEAALRKARETACAPLAVAVLDGGGHLKAFSREDAAGPPPADRAEQGVGRAGNGGRHTGTGPVVPAPGGVLIRDASGAVIGAAVGISGDVSDEACAVAGIEAVRLVADTGAER